MKKILALLLAGAMALSLAACSQPAEDSSSKPAEGSSSKEEASSKEETPKTVTVEVVNGEGQMIDVEFPVAPKKVAVLNYQTLDFLDAMGLEDCIGGVITGSLPEHLKKYAEDDSIVNLGSMKDIDMEALAEMEPDVIFSSDRTAKKYDVFSSIAPTMSCAIVYKDGFMKSYETLAKKHGQIFGLDNATADIIADYKARVEAINAKFGGKTALLGIFAGGLNTLGNTGRAGIVVNEMGFVNAAGDEDVNHGNKSSYEVFLELNPEYMFILDKDTAVGTEAVAAKEQMENDIIKQTDAYKNNKIIYLEPGACWYLCDGGITAFDLMLTDLEEDLGLK